MAIDRNKIIKNVSQIINFADTTGIIDDFDLYLTLAPVGLWNSFSQRLVNSVDPELVDATEYMLKNAAQECAYHTAYNIMQSPEWASIVKPMLTMGSFQEDAIHALCAFVSALGWGNIYIEELVPREKLVLRASDYYEANVITLGYARTPFAYMLTGVSAAFMDIIYGGPYEVTLQTGFGAYKSKQTKGIECGDEYGEFVVEKVRN